MAFISVAENEKYKLKAESNRVNLTLIPPRRGWFIDRNGRPMATNRADFRVDIIPDRLIDKDATVATLAKLLALTDDDVERINRELKQGRGFQPIQVAAGLDYDSYSKVSVRLPELPGVSPRQGFSRYYPDGAAVGHLIGYVGAVSAEEYQEKKNPLLITPGFKIGKDGLEKYYEDGLQGTAGAKRVEVTARGKIVRELTTRSDIPGKPIQLSIDGELQAYAARRLGNESGSVVVIDCLTGDLLTMASMPSFDPNSFSDGIGVAEYKWLSKNDHVPLRNKALSGLYPPGSTVKPMVAMSFLEAGLDPNATATCGGGLRVGNRVFHCWNRRGHGTVNMARAIYQSCDVYFYKFAQQMGMDVIALMAKRLGMGEKFPLEVASQSFGTVPSPAWKLKKYQQPWHTHDTVNSTIGQGYMLANPLQLAIMASRLATGKQIMPHLLLNKKRPVIKPLGFSDEHINYVRHAMSEVVNGGGTAGRARLPVPNVLLAGKTGTAQVVGLEKGRGGKGVPWKYRDHGLFICFAPFDAPRYAAAVVIEHGGGSGAAYPIARDVMTFLYDREKALSVLAGYEAGWGGNIETRMAHSLAAFQNMAANPPPADAPPATGTPPPVSDAAR
jgi:penicillin-binding protein 2